MHTEIPVFAVETGKSGRKLVKNVLVDAPEELVFYVLLRPGWTRRVRDKVKTTGEVRCRWGGGTISTKSDFIWGLSD